MILFLFRPDPDSPAEQHTHSNEEADNSISAETEPPAVESWKTFNYHCSGPSAKDGGLFVCHHTVLLAQQRCRTHPALPTVICYVNVDVLDILYYDMKSNQKALSLKLFGPLFITAKRKAY